MAKVFGMLSDAATGTSAIGVLREFKRSTSAEVKYGLDANGSPDGSKAVVGPAEMSATLEIDGTVPAAGSEITVGSTTYILTKVEETYSGEGEVATVSIEGTEKP